MNKYDEVQLWQEHPDRKVYEEAVNRMASYGGIVFKAIPKNPYIASMFHFTVSVGGYLKWDSGLKVYVTLYNAILLDMSDLSSPVKLEQWQSADLKTAIASASTKLKEYVTRYDEASKKRAAEVPVAASAEADQG